MKLTSVRSTISNQWGAIANLEKLAKGECGNLRGSGCQVEGGEKGEGVVAGKGAGVPGGEQARPGLIGEASSDQLGVQELERQQLAWLLKDGKRKKRELGAAEELEEAMDDLPEVEGKIEDVEMQKESEGSVARVKQRK